jgi:hypothetical protein
MARVRARAANPSRRIARGFGPPRSGRRPHGEIRGQIPIGGQIGIAGQIRRGRDDVHGLELPGEAGRLLCGDILSVIPAQNPALIEGKIRRVPTRSQPRCTGRTLGLAAVPGPLRDTGRGAPEHLAVGHPAAIPPVLPFWPRSPPIPRLPHLSVRGARTPGGARRGRLDGRCVHGCPAPCCSPCWPRRLGVARWWRQASPAPRLPSRSPCPGPTSSPPPRPGQWHPSPPYSAPYRFPFRLQDRPQNRLPLRPP